MTFSSFFPLPEELMCPFMSGVHVLLMVLFFICLYCRFLRVMKVQFHAWVSARRRTCWLVHHGIRRSNSGMFISTKEPERRYRSWLMVSILLSEYWSMTRPGSRIWTWWSGWRSCIFPRIPPLGPKFESRWGHFVDWVFSLYLTVWVFPEILILSSLSITKTSFLVFTPWVLGKYSDLVCFSESPWLHTHNNWNQTKWNCPKSSGYTISQCRINRSGSSGNNPVVFLPSLAQL